MSEFDSYADQYEAALNRGISVSGEDKDFFARGRIAWLARCLRELDWVPDSVLDYGCGTGTATRYLLEILGAKSVLGVDSSEKSLEQARKAHKGLPAEFMTTDEYRPEGCLDLAYCNGVFHHIPVHERPGVTSYIANSLRPDGFFSLWENNPWNPGTRYVMSKIPFDKDAVMVWPTEARKLASVASLTLVRTDYNFIFPRSLKFFRRFEPLLRGLPLGAQYQVLSRK